MRHYKFKKGGNRFFHSNLVTSCDIKFIPLDLSVSYNYFESTIKKKV